MAESHFNSLPLQAAVLARTILGIQLWRPRWPLATLRRVGLDLCSCQAHTCQQGADWIHALLCLTGVFVASFPGVRPVIDGGMGMARPLMPQSGLFWLIGHPGTEKVTGMNMPRTGAAEI
ncbi:hypothetical protein H8959_001155 [Pygathrix nigripes]